MWLKMKTRYWSETLTNINETAWSHFVKDTDILGHGHETVATVARDGNFIFRGQLQLRPSSIMCGCVLSVMRLATRRH
jgi:hypothetical protein